ncbi:MAG: 4Fe-4S binding protein [Gammaproteobacteria bacterium]|nr:4Fe-4S binding protein [Gammaproteobacteria bacterium]MDH5802460.1 4Fe-4S binding protein [Gammaproteobacteria bacterium]
MNNQDSLKDIPITVVPGPVNRLHWQRRAVQILTVTLLVLVPLTGLLRIDPIAGAFVILGRQIWWSDFFLIFGMWILLASALVLVYSTLGTAFCGWSCPQNSLSEWANAMTKKLLGKRAEISLEGRKMALASRKNRWLNWGVLSGMMLLVSAFFALIPLLYFYPPQIIWAFITVQDNAGLAASLHYIYIIFVLLVLLDVAFIRHFWCRFMCIYKVWQHGFKTQQTLHIHYDETRSTECKKCNFCTTACFLELDPKQTNVYDSCVNCGECITACARLQAKKSKPALLSFKIGQTNPDKMANVSTRLAGLSTRVRWTLPFTTLGLLMFVWGLYSYEPYHLSVYRADQNHGSAIRDYRVAVFNKRYENARLSVSIEGLDRDAYSITKPSVEFTAAGRIDLELRISAAMPQGLHSFFVRVQSTDGWQARYRVQHFVGRT